MEIPSAFLVYAPQGLPMRMPHPASIFDIDWEKNEKQQKLDAALDKIRQKYGEQAIRRGSEVTAKKP